MGGGVDLSEADVVDNHCHPFRVDDLLAQDPAGFETRLTLMGMCFFSSQQSDPALWREVVSLTDTTVYSLVARRWLADRLGCQATAEGVAEACDRAIRKDPEGYIRSLLDDERIVRVVTDEGFSLPIIPAKEFESVVGTTVHRVVRIEPIISDLRGPAEGFSEFEEGFQASLEEATGDPNTVAFKSIIAYRTGLDVATVSRQDAATAFLRWRADGFREARQHAKPVRDFLLERTLDVARRHDIAVHIHTGDGDPDIVLHRARPHDLFPLLRRHPDQPIVLIHGGHPWSQQAAYIASLLPNVYLDLSVLIPWAGSGLDQLLTVIIGMVPGSKLLYGSDEASEPEVFWISARLARRSLERVLGDVVDRDFLTHRQARALGMGILAENTRRLHGLTR